MDAAERLRVALDDAADGLVERRDLLELVLLAAVAQEHLLVLGPPGTAKSEAVRRVARAVGGRTFEALLGRFTEPSELFGPVDLRRLREGVLETRVEGMLPEADLAFLDEVFLGSTAILNTLLGLLQERVYQRGATRLPVPLRVCVGASNALPDDPALAAFADRFLVRVFVEPVPDPALEDLLAAGWQGGSDRPRTASLDDLDAVASAAAAMDLSRIRAPLAGVLRRLRGAGIGLSDRRMVKVQRLVAAAAALAGREAPTTADLWPVIHAVPDPDGQALAREVLREALVDTENPTLGAAAEAASAGPRVRATRLAREGEALLEGERTEGWRLRVEGVLREIDAGFDPESPPEPLDGVRPRLVAALGAP
jgi:MoxR-like ATPase